MALKQYPNGDASLGHQVPKQSGRAPFPWCVKDDIKAGVWTKAYSVTLFDGFALGRAGP